jgi:hypothetical protein
VPPDAAAEKLALDPTIPEDGLLTVTAKEAMTVIVANAEPILPVVSVAFTITA